MDDNGKKVQDAVDEVGPVKTYDHKTLLEGMDRLIERIQGMKTHIKEGKTGPLGMLIEEFRDISPYYKFGSVIAEGHNQCGPLVTRITILDWKNAGKTLP